MNWWMIGITYLIMGSPLYLIPYFNGQMNPFARRIYQVLWDTGWLFLVLKLLMILHRLPKWTEYLPILLLICVFMSVKRVVTDFLISARDANQDKERT